MDILRKELDEIYHSQSLEEEILPADAFETAKSEACVSVKITDGCAVVTDIYSDYCYVYSGAFGKLMGYRDRHISSFETASSDEDVIYERIHPEDLVDKRFLEYEFFKLTDNRGAEEKMKYIAKCRIRMKDEEGDYRYVDNTTQLLHLSPAGKIWLILCTYSLSTNLILKEGIDPAIINTFTGEVIPYSFGSKRKQILSQREKEILLLIRDGKPSKQIADILGISINTVNRHRQNILEKLSVGNSVEAVSAATLMNLL